MRDGLLWSTLFTVLVAAAVLYATESNEPNETPHARRTRSAKIDCSVDQNIIAGEEICWEESAHESFEEEMGCFFSPCTLVGLCFNLNFILLPTSVAVTWFTMSALLQIIIHTKRMKETHSVRATVKQSKHRMDVYERLRFLRGDSESPQSMTLKMKVETKGGEERVHVLQNKEVITMTDDLLVHDTHGVVRKGFLSVFGDQYLQMQITVKELIPQYIWEKEHDNLTKAMSTKIETFKNKCDHINLIKYYGCESLLASPHSKILILMERVDQSLHQLIHEDAAFAQRCTYHSLLQIFLGIVSGLQYLHESMGVIHFNLRPQNIMVQDRKCPKIAGVELALSSVGGSVEINHVQGSQYYMAPEVCLLGGFMKEESQKVNTSVDVFSLGIMMWECIMRTRPSMVTENHFTSDGPRIKMYSGMNSDFIHCDCPQPLRNLIERCVKFDMELYISELPADLPADYQRPSLQEIAGCIRSMLKEAWVYEIPVQWKLVT